MRKPVPLIAGLALIATLSLLPAKAGHAIDVYSWDGHADTSEHYSGPSNGGGQEQFWVTPSTSPADSSINCSTFFTNTQGNWLGLNTYSAHSTTVWEADALPRDQVLSWGVIESMQPSDPGSWVEHQIGSMYTSGPSGSLTCPTFDHYAGGSNSWVADFPPYTATDGYTDAEALVPADYYQFSHGVSSYFYIDSTLPNSNGAAYLSAIDSVSGQTVEDPQ